MAIVGSVSLTATDAAGFAQSLDRIMALAGSAEEHGGRFLVMGGTIEAVTGESGPDRVMVLEFEHVGQARSWLRSAEFAEFKELAGSCSDVQAMILEGL